MKKNTLIVLSILILVLLTACYNSKESNKAANEQSNVTQVQDVREAVWSQLTSNDQERIKGKWQDSTLQKITLHEFMGKINDKSYIGKEVYLVDFKTNSNSISNNMGVYASCDHYKIIGYGYVD